MYNRPTLRDRAILPANHQETVAANQPALKQKHDPTPATNPGMTTPEARSDEVSKPKDRATQWFVLIAIFAVGLALRVGVALRSPSIEWPDGDLQHPGTCAPFGLRLRSNCVGVAGRHPLLGRTAWRMASSVSKIVPKRNGSTVAVRKLWLTTRACSRTDFSSSLEVARSYSLTITANSPLG